MEDETINHSIEMDFDELNDEHKRAQRVTNAKRTELMQMKLDDSEYSI